MAIDVGGDTQAEVADRIKNSPPSSLPETLLLLVGTLFTCTCAGCISEVLPALWSWLRTFLWPQLVIALGVDASSLAAGLSAICAGLFLYWIKLNYRRTYGLMEVLVGMTSVMTLAKSYSSRPTTDDPSELSVILALSSGLYIVVRGINNFHDYYKDLAQKAASAQKEEELKRLLQSRRDELSAFEGG
jgi:hypothetical protein